ncbi:hypothetical protein [Paenibacillus sp. MZ03-122A]|uniref:hypothetical protein n=1 Tax=Paenibacillus sp. MZ03-122A TaxID=2962033 RepID=UPI0020B8BFDF|nr:hypothetical protein [Paenibacillus sp. MZ03-122A]MCP3781449.1 hypothetical protein [Paenibacillus sp. MZ03-122A]
MKSILPVYNPPLLGFLRWPYTLSITMGYNETLPWFYTNFIQVKVNKNFHEKKSEFNFNFYRGERNEFTNNPFISTTSIDVDFLNGLNHDILSFLKYSIDSGYYVVMLVDEFFIPGKDSYLKENYPHHIFIYGYDFEKKVLFLTGFSHGVYGHNEINFYDFINSYKSIINMYNNNLTPKDNIYLMKFNSNHSYNFSEEVFKDEILSYYYSKSHTDSLNYINADNEYGLKTYKHLIYYYSLLSEEVEINDFGKIRSLHILWEHKNMMVKRLEYLSENGHLNNVELTIMNYKKMANKAIILRNLILKSNVHVEKSVYIKVINGLRDLELIESEALGKVLELFRKN